MKNLFIKVSLILSIIFVSGAIFVLSGCAVTESDFETREDEKVTELEKQIESLNKIIEMKNIEIIEINDKYREKDIELKKVIELYEKLVKDNNINIEIINSLKKQIIDLMAEIESLNVKLNLANSSSDAWKEKYNELSKMYQELLEKFKNSDKVIEELKEKIVILEKENQELRNKAAESKTLYVYGKTLGYDKRNWCVNGVIINNIDLVNGCLYYNGYKIVFVEC